MRRSGRITSGMQSERTILQDSAFSSSTPAPTSPELPSEEEPGSGLTVSALGVSAPASTNGVWPSLRPVSVAQKNKPSTTLPSNVQSIDLPMDCTAWWFWTMRQSNGCAASGPRSSAAKQWIEELAQKMKKKKCLFIISIFCRYVTRGVEAPLAKFLASSGKMCWAELKTIRHSLKIMGPSQKTLGHPWSSKPVTDLIVCVCHVTPIWWSVMSKHFCILVFFN